jgi:hypothetical protein
MFAGPSGALSIGAAPADGHAVPTALARPTGAPRR